MKLAVIKTGGKQYLVGEGTKVKVEKLSQKEGKAVAFPDVLMTVTDKAVTLGEPDVDAAKVEGKVVRHGRREKVFGVKMKAKKRERKYFGHKQWFTEVEITKITTR
ncbi:MAG: 50S ribosomal protein L21 [Patescibacteria group bacterium]